VTVLMTGGDKPLGQQCTCTRCGACGGSGNVWFAFDGTYPGNSRCDDLDDLETCDECRGSGISAECDYCAFQREIEDYE